MLSDKADTDWSYLQLDSLEPQMNRAHVVTSDGGRVTVALKTATFDSSFVEFEGIVDAPNQLREEARCEFGSSFGEPLPQTSYVPRISQQLQQLQSLRCSCTTRRLPLLTKQYQGICTACRAIRAESSGIVNQSLVRILDMYCPW